MKISSISNLVASYSAYSGEGWTGSGQSPESGYAGSTQPFDSVHLSSTAEAYLAGADTVNSEYDPNSLDIGYASRRRRPGSP